MGNYLNLTFIKKLKLQILMENYLKNVGNLPKVGEKVGFKDCLFSDLKVQTYVLTKKEPTGETF